MKGNIRKGHASKMGYHSLEDRIFDTVNILLLLIVAFITLYPFYYVLILSFNNGNDAARGGIYLWPRLFSLDNYSAFLNDIKWLKSILVTILRTVSGTAISVIFTSMVGYGLSKKNLIFRKGYYRVLIICMYCSGGLIPYYLLLKALGLLDNFGVYIIPGALNLFFVMIAVSFFQEMPEELMESAYLDGAGEIQVIFKIVLPLSLPLMATMILFIGVNHWNSWLDSAYYVQNNDLRTLAYRMMEVVNQTLKPASSESLRVASEVVTTTTTRSVQMAAMIIATAPIICLYPFLQKYFTQGFMLGAVKG